MNKCIFCDKEFVPHGKDVAMDVGLKLEKASNNLLAMLYPHVFNYCPNCKVVEFDLDDKQKEIVRQKKDEILKILKNEELASIDKNYAIRQAEVKGYICELLNDKVGLVLGYKAMVDMLNAYINEFLDESTRNVLNKDGRSFRLLDSEKIKVFEYAKTHRDLINRLIIGKIADDVINELGFLGILIYIDVAIDLIDCNIAVEEILKKVKSLIDMVRPFFEEDNPQLMPVLEELENKYLLKAKYIN